MINIYNYINYRQYLEDFYREQKADKSTFSFRYFALKAGFKAKSFIKLVIDGNKNLTDNSINKLNCVLKLSPKKFSYFKLLVAFNQSKSSERKNYYFDKLSAFNARNTSRLLQMQQYEFFSKWYHGVIRELISYRDFHDDYKALGNCVQPGLSARQVRQSVLLLLKLGLIRKKNGRYVQTNALLSTGDEVHSLAISNYHIQNLSLAAESIDTCPESLRDVSGLILGLDKEHVEEVKTEIQKFRKKLLGIAARVKNPNRVYNINLQMFPTSNIKELS